METIRHSAAHVMAAAVCRLYKDAKIDIGPATDEGFYYDFDLEHRLTPEDFPQIEEEMRKIIAADLPFERKEVTREEAKDIFKDQPYKLERLADVPDGELSLTVLPIRVTDTCCAPCRAILKEV